MARITDSLRVDPSNTEMATAWDGDEGAYWAAHAEHFDRSVAAYHLPFLAAAAIGRREQVLDIGCGTGQTTRDAARRAPAGGTLGVDLSSEMIAVARRLAVAEDIPNTRFEQADAQIYPFAERSFDVVISRTGAMFFGDPPAAFANIARALRSGGRLALLPWQTPAGCASCWRAPGSRVSRSAHCRPRCGSAPTPTTRTCSRSGSWAGCLRASTRSGTARRSARCGPPSAVTSPPAASSTSPEPG